MPKPSVCGVQVLTWGTKPERSNGMLNFLDSELFGGDVGHASIVMTIPANESGKLLIDHYCEKYDIPYEEKEITVKAPDGQVILEESVYVIHWSWWPSQTTRYLGQLKEDVLREAEGYHESWTDEAKSYFKPEERHHTGILGSQVMTSKMTNIAHQRQLSTEDYQRIKALSELRKLDSLIESIKLLKEKLLDKKYSGEPILLSKTEILLLNRNISDWRTFVANEKRLTQQELALLKERAALTLDDYKREFISISLGMPLDEVDANVKILDSTSKLLQKMIQENTAIAMSDKGISILNKIIPGWNSDIKNVNHLTEEEGKNLNLLIQNHLSVDDKKSRKAVISSLQENLDIDDINVESYFTEGHSPDGVVKLPINDPQVGRPGGLSPEGMLIKMVELSTSEKFDLHTMNCSKTVDTILESGAQQPYQKKYFQNKAFGFFGNPQEAHNNAMDFAIALERGKPGIIQSMIDFNPIERLGGRLIGIIMNKNVNALQKGLAVAAGIPVGVLALISYGIQKLMNPLKTFQGATQVINYAFSRNSILLRGLAVILVGPFLAIFSLPAAIQYGAQKTMSTIMEPFKYGTQVVRQRIQSGETTVEALRTLERQSATPAQNQTIENQDTAQKEQYDKLAPFIKEIDLGDPQAALEAFKAVLSDDQDAIPIFSKKTEAVILKYIQKNEAAAEIYAKIMSDSLARVQELSAAKEPSASDLLLEKTNLTTVFDNTKALNEKGKVEEAHSESKKHRM